MVLAAGLAVPTLLAFYFLKLRREEVVVPSTLLWKRAVQDLQVNAPFQRLRRNLLLLLQLLVLLAAIIAIGQPMIQAERPRDQRLVLLIDFSASMNTREADGTTRLEQAKQQASRLVNDLGPADQAMLIAFADQASVLSPFTNDKRRLLAQIEAIRPSDRPTHLKEALQLAEHHSTAQTAESEEGAILEESSADQAQMILFSDGRIEDADELVLRRGSLEIVRIGEQTDNVGIVALEVRRNYENPSRLNVFARVRNFSDQAATTDVTLLLNGQIVDVQTAANLAPGIRVPSTAGGPITTVPADPLTPPKGSVAMVPFDEIEFNETGIAEVRLSRSDAFSADDRAYAIIPPPRRMAVLLVSNGHYFLERVLGAMQLRTFERMTPDEYEALDLDELVTAGRLKYDLVIFDDHSTDKLPPGTYMFFRSGPIIDDVTLGETIDDEYIVTWDDSHPILRYVTFEDVEITSWARLTLPDEAITLVEGETSPVIAYLARDGRQYLLIAFNFFNESRDTLNTTWYLRRGLVVFMYNAIDYLSGSVTVTDTRSVRPGQAIAIAAPDNETTVSITTPAHETRTISVRAGRVSYFGDTGRVGLYDVSPAAIGQEHFAVNLFDENESFVAPNASLSIGTESVESRAGDQLISKPIWPYFLVAALVVLFVEWYIYNKRVLI